MLLKIFMETDATLQKENIKQYNYFFGGKGGVLNLTVLCFQGFLRHGLGALL